MSGGYGSLDLFFLGNNTTIFYNGDGSNGYRLITDLESYAILLTMELEKSRKLNPLLSDWWTLNNLSQLLQQIAQKISQVFPNVSVQPSLAKDGRIRKLVINSGNAIVKVEPNETIRGTVFPCVQRDLCQKAQDEFELFLSLNTLSTADLYGGKICAALDRQHPRDIFDIKILLI